MEPLTVIAGRIVEKITANLVAKWVLTNGEKFLGTDKNEFTKELNNTIYDTIIQFDKNHNIEDEGEKFPFYKSEILIQELLSIKFLDFNLPDAKEIQNKLSANSNIIAPTEADILDFLSLFEENCKKNKTLKQLQFNSNYKEAVFEVLKVLRDIQGTLNKVITEIKSSLKGEYLSQFEEIQKNINDFRPKIALERIQGLETRIKQNELFTPDIESKLLYLKGVCLTESKQNTDGAELIVQAYLKSKNALFRTEAAFAYYNLGDSPTAKELAEKIIEDEPYNQNAWILLVVISEDDYAATIRRVNTVVKNKRAFKVIVSHFLIAKYGLDSYKLNELGLTIPETIEEKVNHSSITVWEKFLHIQLNKFFSQIREISFSDKGKMQGLNGTDLDGILILLDNFFNALRGSDVYECYPLLRFSLNFIRHLLNDAKFNHDEFYADHLKLKDTLFGYDLHYAEYLANTGKLDDALKILNSSNFKDEDQLLFHRIVYTRALGKSNEARDLIIEHIRLIDEIDFPQIFNLNNLFQIIIPDTELLNREFQEILNSKKFESESIKSLFKISIEIYYFKTEINQDELRNQLRELSKHFPHDASILQFIAQLLFQLQDFQFSATLLKPLTSAGKQTIANLIYCQSLYQSSKASPELLQFLKEIRLENEINQYEFLALETNLRLIINDSVELIEISWRGVKQYPNNEFFHQNLLASLERQNKVEEIKEYADKYLKREFRNEGIGIYVSEILSRNGCATQGANILYELAQHPNNHLARTNYAMFMRFPDGFLIDYENVQEGSHVKLVSKELGVKLVTIKADDKYKLIGKARREQVLIPSKSGSELNSYSIQRIMNAPLFLFEQILQESENVNSELGMEMFNFSDESGQLDIKAFEKFLIEKIGVDNDIRKKYVEEQIAKYKKGTISFSDLCIHVFQGELLPCYEYLTTDCFMAIPAIYNSRLPLSITETYALDFTALILFSHLHKKIGIKFAHKFVVSANLVALLRNQVIKLGSSPSPKMNVAVLDGKISPIFFPENFNETQILKYEELLDFIHNNCIEKVVEEKVEFSSVLGKDRSNELYFSYLVDNAMFATTLGYTLISNDSFTIHHFPNVVPKQISPELFFLRHFQGKNHKELIEYFVEKKYLGVTINGEVIFAEYSKMRKGIPNSFNACLSNLRFRISLSPVNISVGIKFLKEVYLNNIATEQENYLLANTIFSNLLDGSSGNENVVQLILKVVNAEFRLMGKALDSVLSAFDSALQSKRQ